MVRVAFDAAPLERRDRDCAARPLKDGSRMDRPTGSREAWPGSCVPTAGAARPGYRATGAMAMADFHAQPLQIVRVRRVSLLTHGVLVNTYAWASSERWAIGFRHGHQSTSY